MMRHLILLLAVLVLAMRSPSMKACDLSAEEIGEIMGVKTTTTPDGVIRVGWPRKDVKVQVDGLPMRPFMGLGTWAAFQKTEHGAMVMGDTVVFQDEVSPAIDAAFASGLEVTGLHNHFFFDEPKVYFMHIGGEGCPDKLAEGVKAVWNAVNQVREKHPQPAESFVGGAPAYGKLDASRLSEIIGSQGEMQDDIYKVTIGRTAEMHGMKFDGSMGLTTWAAFAGSDGSAVMDGDFAMTAAEVQPVLRALRKADINIVALHNHMVGESPTYYFVHFWGKGKAADLAKGFKSAIDAQKQASEMGEAKNGDHGADAEVRDLEHRLSRAVVEGDVDFFDRVLSDDFTHMSQSGRFRTKAEWMKGRRPGESAYTSFDVRDLSVKVLGDTAVVTGVTVPKGKDSGGATIEGRFRFIRVWRKHGGQWQVVAFQGTRVAA